MYGHRGQLVGRDHQNPVRHPTDKKVARPHAALQGIEMIRLTGRIFREEGMFVAEIDQLRQSTWAHSLPEVMQDVPRLVVEYLDSLHVLGTFDDTIRRLGGDLVGDEIEVNIHVKIAAELFPAQPVRSTMAVDSNVSVPLRAA